MTAFAGVPSSTPTDWVRPWRCESCGEPIAIGLLCRACAPAKEPSPDRARALGITPPTDEASDG